MGEMNKPGSQKEHHAVMYSMCADKVCIKISLLDHLAVLILFTYPTQIQFCHKIHKLPFLVIALTDINFAQANPQPDYIISYPSLYQRAVYPRINLSGVK